MVHVPPPAIVPPENTNWEVVLPVKLPPQVVVGVSVLVILVGYVSVKATPVRLELGLGLDIVKVSVVVPFWGMVVPPKTLLMPGAFGLTDNVADAVRPVPPLVEVTAPLVFSLEPSVTDITETLTVHVPETGMAPPENEIEVAFATGANVGLPQLEVVAFVGEATFTPVGKVSLKATPVRTTEFCAGLVRVNVRVLAALISTVEGLKDLLMVGGEATDRVALAELPVPSSVEVTALVVLGFDPPVVAVMLTDAVQVLLAAMVPPLKVRVVAPANGAKVGAPQPDLTTLGVADTCRPAGRLSVNETFVRAALALGLMMVNVRVVVPLTVIASGEKDLLIARPVVTNRVAEAVLPVPPLVEVTDPLVFSLSPLVVGVTLTLTTQVPPAEMVPLVNVSVVAFAAGEKVGVPHPEVLTFGVAATFNPAGRESLKAIPVSAMEFSGGLVMVNVSLLTPLMGTVTGRNAFEM
jgi:hypothetical protein